MEMRTYRISKQSLASQRDIVMIVWLVRHICEDGCPQLDQVHEFARPGERFLVKEESAASVDTRPWTPEGRSLTLSIVFML
ncbi:hypothetical protein AVEN_103928-1 [Araneus ventricosus]|uniref:Uncharacterized protein n=1 Tax=Araneus ventricosus TaxID=182803 RepID=A0A4Y2ITR7_ARAVE|nr:hypothetical protein AVEN_101655-1 [Araneus ventricosus]GBM80328.1 hypothetical protein AVEN_103928-1 [Araneus ventricosus]